MDGDGLPLSSPLPLSQPAVQAPIDIPDAPPSSESTGGDADVDMEESDNRREEGNSLSAREQGGGVCARDGVVLAAKLVAASAFRRIASLAAAG